MNLIERITFMIENIALILLLLFLTTLFVFITTILFILGIPVILVWLLLAVVILGTTFKAPTNLGTQKGE